MGRYAGGQSMFSGGGIGAHVIDFIYSESGKPADSRLGHGEQVS